MDTTRQIAHYLKVSPLQIKSCESWDKVYLVILYGRKPVFVSKKVISMDKHRSVSDISKDLSKEGLDHACLRALVIASVRRYRQGGNLNIARDYIVEQYSYPKAFDNEVYQSVSRSCEVLVEVGVCTKHKGTFILTDLGIQYGNMLTS